MSGCMHMNPANVCANCRPRPDDQPTFPALSPELRWVGLRQIDIEDVAEAWAWRCADTMPDSAQSRRDADADAAQLVSVVRSMSGIESCPTHAPAVYGIANRAGDMLRNIFFGNQAAAVYRTKQVARCALHACPGLR